MNSWRFSKQFTSAAKGVAIIGVVYGHLFQGASPDWIVPFNVDLVRDLAFFCQVVVALFVFLSAFGLTKSWEGFLAREQPPAPSPKHCAKWISSRYLRLMSGFWFVYILAIAVTSFTGRTPASIYGQEAMPLLSALADFFGLGNFLGVAQLNETWWYMSVAVTVMICVPLLVAGGRKFGVILLLFCAVVPNYVFEAYNAQADYILPTALGVFCAQNDTLEKIHMKRLTGHAVLDGLIKLALSLWVLWVMYFVRLYYGRFFLVDAIASLAILIGTVELVEFPFMGWLLRVLDFLGKHSMNIFLVHTFIFSYYFADFIYSFRYPLPITAVLIFCSLAVSFVIERLKKLLRYDALIGRLDSWSQCKLGENDWRWT